MIKFMEGNPPAQENSGETKLLGEIHKTLSSIEEITAQGDEPGQEEYEKFKLLALRFKNENKEFRNILVERFKEFFLDIGNTPQKNSLEKICVEAFKQFKQETTTQ